MCAGVNPFNLTTQLSLAQLRQQWYNCAGRVYSTSDGSDGRAVDVAMICFSLSSQDCENLARHSTRFIQIFQLDHVGGFQDREITMYEGDYTFDIGLARHLITLNAQDVIDLPDCANISLLQFVEICETFGFEQMLDAMAEYCLRVGIHFLPDFFEALIHTYGLLHNRVTMCCNRPFHIDCYRTDPCSGCLVGLSERISCLHPGESNLNHDSSRASIRPRLPLQRYGRLWTRRPWLLPSRGAPDAPIFFT